MRILIAETPDKKVKTIIEIEREVLLKELQQDHGWHEVIPMYDSNASLRIFFDIDACNKEPSSILEETLTGLHRFFRTTNEDWAIASCHRGKNVSFHIVSRLHKCSLKQLRDIVGFIGLEIPWIDESAYWFSPEDRTEEGSLRLPNQSKGAIHKEGPPLVVEQGDLAEFLVTDVTGLVDL
jgi:hypothetical protein